VSQARVSASFRFNQPCSTPTASAANPYPVAALDASVYRSSSKLLARSLTNPVCGSAVSQKYRTARRCTSSRSWSSVSCDCGGTFRFFTKKPVAGTGTTINDYFAERTIRHDLLRDHFRSFSRTGKLVETGSGEICARGLNNSSIGTHCAIVRHEKEVFGPN
jgi:hypothetical protein